MRRMLCAILVLGLAGNAAALVRDDRPSSRSARSAQPENDRLIKLLRDRLVEGTVRERLELMQGLAALRDPSLRPLFGQLASSPLSDLRLQAILASAQIEPERGLDLLSVRRLSDRREQAELIAAALLRDLLAPGQLEDLARWPDLDPRLAVSIAGLLTTSGNPPAPQHVRAILDDAKGGSELRLHAALVLLEQGDHTVQATAQGLLDEIVAIPGVKGDEAVSGVLARIRRQRLGASLPLLVHLREGLATRPLLRFETLATMLAVAPDDHEVIAAAREEMDYKGETPTDRTARRLRVALAMLEPALLSPAKITPELAAPLKDDPDALVSAIHGVLEAVASKGDVGAAAVKLADHHHLGASAWMLRLAKQRPYQEATAIRLVVIAQASTARSNTAMANAVEAASDICDADPAPLKPVLEQALAKADKQLAWAVLAGALRSTNAKSNVLLGAGTGGRPPEWPDAKCRAMADLVSARHGAPEGTAAVDPARLERIATGDGELATPYCLQAAWLAIKARGGERAALARLLSESREASTEVPPPAGP